MEKTATLNFRVNPDLKNRVEKILSSLGLTMSSAIDIYLNQISLTGGIPFPLKLPNVPSSVNADLMTDEELHNKLQNGYNEAIEGKTIDAKKALNNFIKKHKLKYIK
ncbi:MAG: type II toxin-antitoxin system RelB/DinJ family antitoxin [Candidatus Riflebacteria bacterium]|nr:type II toxin-antitoxin system RelB/DinJ family antitoxin [Candidatus Riflebacteria bacterium]